jgi:hypothetical protein
MALEPLPIMATRLLDQSSWEFQEALWTRVPRKDWRLGIEGHLH